MLVVGDGALSLVSGLMLSSMHEGVLKSLLPVLLCGEFGVLCEESVAFCGVFDVLCTQRRRWLSEVRWRLMVVVGISVQFGICGVGVGCMRLRRR